VIKRILDMVKDGMEKTAIFNTLTAENATSPMGKGWNRTMIYRLVERYNPEPKRPATQRARMDVEIQRDKQAASERARQLRQEGYSLRAIAEKLISEGLYPPRGERWYAQNVACLREVQDPSGAAPLAYQLRREGMPLSEIGRQLAYAGYLSPSCGLWDRKTLSDLIARHARSMEGEESTLAV